MRTASATNAARPGLNVLPKTRVGRRSPGRSGCASTQISRREIEPRCSANGCFPGPVLAGRDWLLLAKDRLSGRLSGRLASRLACMAPFWRVRPRLPERPEFVSKVLARLAYG